MRVLIEGYNSHKHTQDGEVFREWFTLPLDEGEVWERYEQFMRDHAKGEYDTHGSFIDDFTVIAVDAFEGEEYTGDMSPQEVNDWYRTLQVNEDAKEEDNAWHTGTLVVQEKEFPYVVKVSKTHAPKLGINGGKIIKLFLKEEGDDIVVMYDWDWESLPKTKQQEFALHILMSRYN